MTLPVQLTVSNTTPEGVILSRLGDVFSFRGRIPDDRYPRGLLLRFLLWCKLSQESICQRGTQEGKEASSAVQSDSPWPLRSDIQMLFLALKRVRWTYLCSTKSTLSGEPTPLTKVIENISRPLDDSIKYRVQSMKT